LELTSAGADVLLGRRTYEGFAENWPIQNASLQLALDDAAALTGIRVTFANLGIILGANIVAAILNHSAAPGIVQANIF
jgi:dihydrofolate reductase